MMNAKHLFLLVCGVLLIPCVLNAEAGNHDVHDGIVAKFRRTKRLVLGEIARLPSCSDPQQAIDGFATSLQTSLDRDLAGILNEITQAEALLKKQSGDLSANPLLSKEDVSDLQKALAGQLNSLDELQREVSSFRDACVTLQNGALDRWKAAYAGYLDVYGKSEAAKRLGKLTSDFTSRFPWKEGDPALIPFGKDPDIPKDPAAAFQWYKSLADAGDPGALYALGICYSRGIGVQKDPVQAIQWFQGAAAQGNPLGMNSLGECYAKGEGVTPDLGKANDWYQKSADAGCDLAQNHLGYAYEHGLGVQADLPKAVQWYGKAADQNNATAQFNLGICHARGFGVEKNLDKAFAWFQKAADQGLPAAEAHLGFCYEKGKGVAADPNKAFIWYQKAAVQGNHMAEYNLGTCYEYGSGVAKDPVQAIVWYQKAAAYGLPRAKEKLASLQKH
jgi:TPR repeat protein